MVDQRSGRGHGQTLPIAVDRADEPWMVRIVLELAPQAQDDTIEQRVTGALAYPQAARRSSSRNATARGDRLLERPAAAPNPGRRGGDETGSDEGARRSARHCLQLLKVDFTRT